MSIISRISIAYKALAELGLQSVALNGLYRFGLATGHYQRVLTKQLRTSNREQAQRNIEWGTGDTKVNAPFTFPTAEEVLAVIGEAGKAIALAQADEIVDGRVRLFGAEPVALRLTVDGSLADWTAYERGRIDLRPLTPDIKFLWEPARFGWAFGLGRAYLLTQDKKYPECFWHYFEVFSDANPAYRGPQWMSGQEVALRLMALAWAGKIFSGSPASTPERWGRLARSIAEHAARIPPTLVYGRSQRNNHLLVEAAGLLTAGLAIPAYPAAQKWRCLGWKWLTEGLRDQIDGYGEYSQHSTNYHRLMLQVVLWAHALIRNNELNRDYRWPRPGHEAITRSVHWLLALLDPDSGQAPNLGANDGAYIFPLTICPFGDFRPVLYAAARAFLDYDLPHGQWDEMSCWFGVHLDDKRYVHLPRYLGDQIYGKDSWAYLRTAQFTSRPSHADQLHLDLWWRGLDLTQDAGTYLYNAPAPWNNCLTTALVHNTVTVNGRDQMTRAGRFLYVDWVNAYRQGSFESDPSILQRLRGRYLNFWQGYRHTRLVTVFSDEHWRVEDEIVPWRLLPLRFSHPVSWYRLHWLLPDWEWDAEKSDSLFEIRLKSPYGWVTLKISGGDRTPLDTSLVTVVRAGETLYGPPPAAPEPIRGWISPTYGLKVPALSVAIESRSADDVQFISEFVFP